MKILKLSLVSVLPLGRTSGTVTVKTSKLPLVSFQPMGRTSGTVTVILSKLNCISQNLLNNKTSYVYFISFGESSIAPANSSTPFCEMI